MNNNLVLISGKTATGKSASLMGFKDPEGVMYLNCENNKALPFPAKFMKDPKGNVGFTITDPMQIFQAFAAAEKKPEVHTIVIDTLTYLMDMFESKYVITADDTRSAWGEYAQYFKKLMTDYVAKSSKNIVFLAHVADIHNETEMTVDTMVKVKGSLMNNGIESFFSTVISTKKVDLSELADYKNDLLTISPQEEALGYKHCFQVNLTKETKHERIRSALGMWDSNETYIDNNIQHVLDRLHTYFN